MSLPPPYPDLRPSELSWAPLIPIHWSVKRAKYLFNLERRHVRLEDDVVTAFRDGEVTLRSKRRTDGFTNSEKEIGYQGVRAGDLVIHAMDAFAGAVGVSDSDGKCTPVYSCCTSIGPVSTEYYGRMLRAMALTGFIESLSKGIRERSTDFRWREFAEQFLPVPPLHEQDLISRYIDSEAARIDGLVATKVRFINLLREKQIATITAAVVNGIKTNAPKQSMIPWIKDSPVHWTVMPLSAIASRDSGLFIDGDWIESKDLADEGIRYITTGNVGRGVYKEQGSGFISEATFRRLNCTEVLPGDILISRLNSPIARACIVPDLNSRVVTSVDNVIVRPSPAYDRRFLVYLLSSAPHFFNTENLARGTTMQRISRSALGRIRFAVPTFAEQAEIADHLDHEVDKIQRLIAKTERSIELLKEHRSALIAAAVTGKIDVRGLAAKNVKAPA